jgi:ankyrin repeat protein
MDQLFDAIKRGDQAVVASLLDSDKTLLRAAQNGVSAILLALYHGHPQIAQLFVDRGAVLSFAEACALGDLDRVRTLLSSDPALLQSRSADGYPAIGLSIFFRQPKVARYLIERGADVNAPAQNTQKVAPVHAAAAVGDHETMRMLLERGADPNARQQLDFTPFHAAAIHGDIEMARLLLEHGGDPKAKTADGKIALEIAEKNGQLAFRDWLRTVT